MVMTHFFRTAGAPGPLKLMSGRDARGPMSLCVLSC